MPVKIQRIGNIKCQLGEAPFWDEKSQSLYFVDIQEKAVHHYIPSTNTHVKAVVGDKTVSFIIPIENTANAFLIGFGNEIAKLKWDGASDKIQNLETVAKVENIPAKKNQFNDGKADPSGRLWVGTFIPHESEGMRANEASFYTLKDDKTLETLLSKVTLSNGLVWNEKIKKFYYIDSLPGEVYQFDYVGTKLSNRQAIFKFSENDVEGLPDGMTIDIDGNLWIACFGGSKIIKIDPRQPNTLLQVIEMPVSQVTCVEFGGPNYEEMYVTTAGISFKGAPAPEGGWTYKITGLGVRGLPARRIKL